MIQGRVFQSVREMKLRLGGLELQSLYSVCVAWLVIGMAKAAVAQTKVRRPGCLGECGGVIIPYPFGIVGPGLEDCYIPGFNVSCEDGVPRLLGLPDSNNFTLSQIQIPDHLVHLQSSNITAIDCINSTTQNNHRTKSANVSLGGRFTISSQRNKFKAFGCNATATITAGSSLVGLCEAPGQCKIALPDRSYSFSYNVSNRVDYSKSSCSTPCSFAMLVEESFLANYSYFSSQTSPANVSSMPLVAEWEIQDGLCNPSSGWSPTCGQNAFCSYSSGTGSSSGYRCICMYCKKGNPYLNGTAGCAGLIKKRSKKKILLVIMAGGIFLLGTLVYCLWRNLLKGKGSPRINKSSNATIFEDNERKDLDIPFFEFESILTATDNFSEANKLGQGGFGSVYKGKLTAGQEVAVKRLSKGSKQGQEEFKNEATVIAKLQHKNLVRLLGYSTKGDERLLLYEYMPNKSLDRLLFDSNGCKLLSWDKRYNIILGIARGLVYLHEDSRLRIIHRDLKTSNVLLNEELEPKISDFGMARIFGGNQIQENTKRVVGTYGYMAPEYASHGIFSVKSDVFSFGVILLEIVSGKKNTLFYLSDQSTNLLTHAWELWKEGKWMDVIDRNLIEECNMFEAEKCIRIGLLCVQENILDRPTMATVVGMFVSGQTQTLPPPKQPALITTTPSHPNSSPASINDVTISTIECR